MRTHFARMSNAEQFYVNLGERVQIVENADPGPAERYGPLTAAAGNTGADVPRSRRYG